MKTKKKKSAKSVISIKEGIVVVIDSSKKCFAKHFDEINNPHSLNNALVELYEYYHKAGYFTEDIPGELIDLNDNNAIFTFLKTLVDTNDCEGGIFQIVPNKINYK